jgi:outer membrane biosynthesis protein TonB
MTERQALIGAGVAHMLLFAALSIGWEWRQQVLPPADEIIAIEFVDIADAQRVTQAPKPSREAAPQETSAPAPAEAAVPEPMAVPDAVPPPEKPKEAPKKAEAPPADAKPLDMSKLSNLIDKALPKARTKPLDVSKLATTIEAAAPRAAAIDPRAAATIAQAIRSQVAPCWNPPIGGADVRRMTVLIRADFSRDGRLIGVPSIVSQTGVTVGNADYARAFAETARRALLRCSPLKLPAQQYDLWKSAEINFDPESMT